MRKVHYSWVVCAACTLLMFCTVGLPSSAFAVFQPYIIAVNGFTNTQAASVITVRSVSAVIMTFMMDHVIHRLGVRTCAALAPVGIACGYFMFAMSRSYYVYIVAAAVVGAFYAMGGMLLVSMIIARWFNSHRAFAYSICTAGTGLAVVVAPPIVTLLAENFSLRAAFLAEAALMIFAALVAGLLVRNNPEEKGLTAYVTGGDKGTPVKVYRDNKVPFALLAAGCLGCLIIGGITNYNSTHVASLFRDHGMDPMHVSTIISAHGLTLMIFKFVYGRVVDAKGGKLANLLFSAAGIIGHVVLYFAALWSSFPLGCISMAVIGIGLPLGTVGVTVVATELSTKENFPRNLKFMQSIYSIGALAYSIVPGVIADLCGS